MNLGGETEDTWHMDLAPSACFIIVYYIMLIHIILFSLWDCGLQKKKNGGGGKKGGRAGLRE